MYDETLTLENTTMKHNLLICALSAALMTLASASSWSQEQAVDCATARDDIDTLQGEKEKTDDNIAHGIFAYTPIGLIANEANEVVNSDGQSEQDINAYNQKLQQKIDEIQQTCHIE
jgi:hypothetical protein